MGDAAVEEELVLVNGEPVYDGDFVKVRPSRPKKRDGFVGRIKKVWVDEDGVVTAVDVFGGQKGRERYRSLRPERIETFSERVQSRMQREAAKAEVEDWDG